MKPRVFLDVDPRELRVSSSRRTGADPIKLQKADCPILDLPVAGIPPIIVYEGTDGVLVIYNGVTRATRMAKLAPGKLVRVEVIGPLLRLMDQTPR